MIPTSVRVSSNSWRPGHVSVEAQMDSGKRVNASVGLSSLLPGNYSLCIDADGMVGIDLPSPVWSTPVHIPAQWSGVTQAVVPAMVLS